MGQTTGELREWLLEHDAATIDGRTEHLAILLKEYGTPSDQWFHGGLLCKHFFEEARWCFINSQYIACVLLCQSFFEQSLQAMLSGSAPSIGVSDTWLMNAGFCALVEKAEACGLLSDVQAADLHWLRRTRVQYVHPKPHWSGRHIDTRAVEEGKPLEVVCAEDALKAIQVMLRLNQERPFQWG